jgi:flagellar biogenesis protein FliO
MFVMASVIVLLVEALVVVLLLVGALLWLFFLLRQRRPRYSGPDPTTRAGRRFSGTRERPLPPVGRIRA